MEVLIIIEIKDPVGKQIVFLPFLILLWPILISVGLRTGRGELEKCFCFKVFPGLDAYVIPNSQEKLLL